MSRSSRTVVTFTISLVLVIIGVAAWVTTRQPAVATPDQQTQLRSELQQIRDGLSLYAKKHGRYPVTLEEMVVSGEIPGIPVDPITRSADSWKLIRETSVAMDDFVAADASAAPASPIVDIRSGASGADASGVAWSEY